LFQVNVTYQKNSATMYGLFGELIDTDNSHQLFAFITCRNL